MGFKDLRLADACAADGELLLAARGRRRHRGDRPERDLDGVAVGGAAAAGWPPAFLGDPWYYMVDFDIREQASEIDTSRVGVHILSGEYDYSGTVELGRAAHEAIPGSTFAEMPGLGHFPMSEDPEAFLEQLLPVLDCVASQR